MNYKITYGNTEAYNTESASDYDSAVRRSEEVRECRFLKSNGEVSIFPASYVIIENIKTGNEMTWRSKDSMDFEGVL